jgi:hypothetical protein
MSHERRLAAVILNLLRGVRAQMIEHVDHHAGFDNIARASS